MKKKIGIAVLLLLGAAAAIWYMWIYPYYPYYNGKWVYSWKDQAINDPNPAARREATENLIKAFRGMRRGEPRIQLVLHFCYVRSNDRGEPALPKEVIPFLIEALHAPELHGIAYPALALSQVEDAAALPALIEVVRNDEDARTRADAVAALSMMGAKAKAAEPDLRRALDDKDEDVREQAKRALDEMKQGK